MHGGTFYESTGLYRESTVRRVEVASGTVLHQVKLDNKYFGEGLCSFGTRLYQLTWREHTVLVYDRASLALERTVQVPYEGWGLTHDGHSLILSDGSETLYWLDPETLAERRRVVVRVSTGAGGVATAQPLRRLNELEFIDGAVWANVWMDEIIAVIEPITGFVRAILNAGYVYPKHERPADGNSVLNGIAFEQEQRRLFITGKKWPLMYEIELPQLP